ncbi:cysteine hydrolase family protein [Paraglaciecola sp. L3A3]|uniref:cysteine hydrolase family protein n=1 Tax=Paraglaciecola sp. L3A3 TaxID=2686358 RepID=UPI00131A903B|nr:cysteine hydrolase [Paraglaciecola sp. L3A3]
MDNSCATYQLTELQPSWVSPTRTALCIIDVQVDFASPEGLLGQFGLDMSPLQPALNKCLELVESARKAGVPVYFIGLKTSAKDDSPAWRERMTRQGKDAEIESAICREGTSGMDFYKILPEPTDPVIYKGRYSAFYDTQFNQKLKTNNINTLVFCGITTECCVESTVRDAFHHDYHTIVAPDACAAYETDVHNASLYTMASSFALLSNTHNICEMWEK